MNDRTAVRSGGLAITNPKIMLFALLLVYILNFLDRQIVNILAEPIKGELGLSDTQLGLLAGPAFAVFYAVLGIPIARYADNAKTNRVWLISICLAIWSAMTAICGFAQNFAQLALARIGVGVGEAGCTPAAHSPRSEPLRACPSSGTGESATSGPWRALSLLRCSRHQSP